MADQPSASGRHRINASEVNGVEIVDDGQRLRLRMRDESGHAVAVTLPVRSLNSLLQAVSRSDRALLAGPSGEVHAVDTWSIDRVAETLVLTLHLPDGASIAFGVKSWQIAAMASLAEITPKPKNRSLH